MKLEEKKSTMDKILGFLKLTAIIFVAVLILGAIIIRSTLNLEPNDAAPKALNAPFVLLSFIISIALSVWITRKKIKEEEEKKEKAELENIKRAKEQNKKKQ